MRYQEKKRYAPLTRRALVLGGGGGVVSALLLARLYHLQFLQGDRYRTLAEGNRIKLHLTTPMRGVLTDRHGLPVATNDQNYRLLLRPDATRNLAASIEAINEIVHLGFDKVQHILQNYKPRRYAPPILLKEYLTWEEVAKIEFHSADIPGAMIEVGQVRHYRYDEAMAHVLGYVGTVSEQDLDDRDLLKLPDFKTGKDGVEKVLEHDLRGTPGVKEVEVNVHGLAVRELNNKPSIPGKEIKLTLDARLQEYTFDLLEGESAGCVVMDVHSGDILTLMSTPAFDPNRFSKIITTKYWNALRGNKKAPLRNKAIAGQYPPGSTFKMVVGLAGLKNNTMTAGERIYCPGHYKLGNHTFNCWKAGGHGHMDLHDAITQSCDTYFYTIANRMGIENMMEMAREFGLGEDFELPIPHELTGLVPTPKWKRRRYDQPWQGGDTINASIGQGYMLATPLQLAVMTARLANGQKAVMPRLIIPQEEAIQEFESLPVPSGHIRLVQKAMESVVNTQRGTAYSRRIVKKEWAMAGKTGTSQVRKILERGQDQSELPWEYRHHAWFVGYAPMDKPKYAAALIVEHGGGGGSAAAPRVRDILTKAQQLEEDDRKIVKPPPPSEEEKTPIQKEQE